MCLIQYLCHWWRNVKNACHQWTIIPVHTHKMCCPKNDLICVLKLMNEKYLTPWVHWSFGSLMQLVACAAADNVGNSGSGGRLDWGSLSNPPHAVASCPRAHPCCPFACPSCPFLCPWPMFPFCPVEHPLAYPCCQLAHPTVVLTSSENPDPRIAFGDS